VVKKTYGGAERNNLFHAGAGGRGLERKTPNLEF